MTQLDKQTLLPSPLGIIKRSSDKLGITNLHKKEINIQTYGIGDKYANAFSARIYTFSARIYTLRDTQVLNIYKNRLTNKGPIIILQRLPFNIVSFNLSHNQLSLPSFTVISQILETHSLKKLVLEDNRGGDAGVSMLCLSLAQNSSASLTLLNVAKNRVTDESGIALKEMLSHNTFLKVLILHWNQIQLQGGALLFKGLRNNTTLQILDASFNPLADQQRSAMSAAKSAGAGIINTARSNQNERGGSEKTVQARNLCGREIKRVFRTNKTLIHLDFTHCGFQKQECKLISDGLMGNRVILGIHLMGNDGMVDSFGFVSPKKNCKPRISHLFSRIPG
jgi:hypothetical protein